MAPGRQVMRLGGHDVAVTSAGAGEESVVLVHGIGVSGRYFGPLVDVLARTTRVVVPDLPGFGTSPRPSRALGIDEHARVVIELVERCGLDRPVVLGHSMGAQVAAEVAVQRPGLVGGVVLAGPVVEPGARSVARQAWRLVSDYRLEALRANLITVADWLRCGPVYYGETLPSMMAYPLEDRIAEVLEPVVLLRGERDPVAPRPYLELLADRALAARIVVVPGEGHIAMYRRPELVAAVCRGVRVR
jgi:pimeloyl-ACP methyl ester carboxylesterase